MCRWRLAALKVFKRLEALKVFCGTTFTISIVA